MSRRSLGRILPAVLLGLVVLLSPGAALAYIDQSQVQILLSGPNVVRCDRAASISARVVSTRTGRPVRRQTVSWSLAQSRSGGDGLSATTTVTNRRGRTSVSLSFGPVAGARSVRATASRAGSSVTVRCAGGLPATSIRPPDGLAAADGDAASALVLRDPGLGTAAGRLPVERIRIERLGIELPVIEGDGVSVPEGMASHFPGTAWPGQGSNAYLYAHAREGSFLGLWQVRTGELVEIDLPGGDVIEYRVTDVHPVVAWDALEYLAPTATERLTLQTSLWYHDTAPRFVVIAEPVPEA